MVSRTLVMALTASRARARSCIADPALLESCAQFEGPCARRGKRASSTPLVPPSIMTSVNDASTPTNAATPARRRPGPVPRWCAALFVALVPIWVLSAVAVGSFGMNAVGWVVALGMLATAVMAGLGHRWAYGAVAAVGLLLVVVGIVDAGMLSAAFWLAGGLYTGVGLWLLVASRPRRVAPGAARTR